MFEIENGHMLSKHPDKCKFPHGHTRKVELVVEADDLDGSEMICDFKVFKDVIGKFLDKFDHAMCMNTEDAMYPTMKERYGDRVIGFGAKDPTTELMAHVFYDELQRRIHGDESAYPVRESVRVVKVRVWETSSSWGEYGQLTDG